MEQESELCQVLARNKQAVHADLLESKSAVDEEIVKATMKNIDGRAACRGQTCAATVVQHPACIRLHTAKQGLAMDCGVAARSWTQQDVYHALKPARDVAQYTSYRILGLSQASGRLQEEMWMVLGVLQVSVRPRIYHLD